MEKNHDIQKEKFPEFTLDDIREFIRANIGSFIQDQPYFPASIEGEKLIDDINRYGIKVWLDAYTFGNQSYAWNRFRDAVKNFIMVEACKRLN